MKKIIAAALALFVTTATYAQQLPAGSVGVLANNTANTWQTFSYTFTPTTTGANFVGFAFRQDPAFWTFDNVSLTASGSTTNLLTNGGFDNGGRFNITTNNGGSSSIQAPTNWGVWYQNGTYPAAAGQWQNGAAPHGGVWYDGAVGTFDGIYQGVNLTAGTVYTISFEVSGNNVANTSSVQLGTYGGACANVSVAPDQCMIPSSAGFTTLATPAQGASAGAPAVTPVGSPTAGAINGNPSIVNGNWIAWATVSTDARTNSGNNGVVTRTIDNYDRRSVTRRVVVTPTSTQNYSDGTSVTTNGTPFNQDTLLTPEQRLGSSNSNSVVFNRMGFIDAVKLRTFNTFAIDPINKKDGAWFSPNASYYKTLGSMSSGGANAGYQWTADGNTFGVAVNYGSGKSGGLNYSKVENSTYDGSAYILVKDTDVWVKAAVGYGYSQYTGTTSIPLFALANNTKFNQTTFYGDLTVYSADTYFDVRPLVGATVVNSLISGLVETGSFLLSTAPDTKSTTSVNPYVGLRFDLDKNFGIEGRVTQSRDFKTVGSIRATANTEIMDDVFLNASVGVDKSSNLTGVSGMIGIKVNF